jgi:hypothetical protein
MGVVFRARQQPQPHVALKFIHPEKLSRPSRAALLSRSGGGLNHPSIVTIYSVGQAIDYLSMNWWRDAR